jgi:hypothetical protein
LRQLLIAAIVGATVAAVGAASAHGAGWRPALEVAGPYEARTGSCTTCSRALDMASLAMRPNGDATVIWSIGTVGATGSGTVRVSDRPLGGAWSAPTTLSTTAAETADARVAVAANGDAAAIWRQRIGAYDVAQVSTRPLGGSWSAPETIGSATINADDVRIGIDAAGAAVAAWSEGSNDPAGTANYRTRPAGGAWSITQTYAAPRTFDLNLAVNEAGAASIIWTEEDVNGFKTSFVDRPAGGAFGPEKQSGYYGARLDANVALDTAGNRFAVRAAQPPPGADWKPQVSFMQAGQTASTVQDLDGASPGKVMDVTVSTDAQGNALAAWEREVGTGPGTSIDIRYSMRPAGGSFGQAATLVSEAGRSTDVSMLMNAAGDAIAVWLRNVKLDEPPGPLVAAERPSGGAWTAPHVLTGPGAVDDPRLSFDGLGYATAVFPMDDGTSLRLLSAVYDPVPPVLNSLNIPATATAGRPASFSVSPTDAWTAAPASHWDFGDGQSADGASVSHAYAAPGQYAVTVTATDETANSSSASGMVQVGPAPPAAPTPTPLKLTLVSRSVKSGAAVLTLKCQGPAGATCHGQARLSVVKRLRGNKVLGLSAAVKVRKKRVALARKNVVVGAGKTMTVRVPLGRAGKKLLRGFRKVPARLNVVQTDTARPVVVATGKLAFKGKKKK